MAYEVVADEVRACAHWRAAAALEPRDDWRAREAYRCRARALGEQPAVLTELRAREKPSTALKALLGTLEAGPAPAYDDSTGPAGRMEARVECEGDADCATPVVITANGRVLSPWTPSTARTGAGRVALARVVRGGTYRTLLIGGAASARGKVTVVSGGVSQVYPFEAAPGNDAAGPVRTRTVALAREPYGFGY
ncbi:MAG: hypothetical protein FJ104_17910 [Deltaproteobacteria bacterium]|nr:hypothetical protein [Deltaproteobacteria bacterium]